MDMSSIIKEAIKMQENMKKMEKELESSVWSVSVAQEKIKLTMNGNFEVKELLISEEILKEDPEKVSKLIIQAINKCVNIIRKEKEKILKTMLPVPPGLPGIGPLFS